MFKQESIPLKACSALYMGNGHYMSTVLEHTPRGCVGSGWLDILISFHQCYQVELDFIHCPLICLWWQRLLELSGNLSLVYNHFELHGFIQILSACLSVLGQKKRTERIMFCVYPEMWLNLALHTFLSCKSLQSPCDWFGISLSHGYRFTDIK